MKVSVISKTTYKTHGTHRIQESVQSVQNKVDATFRSAIADASKLRFRLISDNVQNNMWTQVSKSCEKSIDLKNFTYKTPCQHIGGETKLT